MEEIYVNDEYFKSDNPIPSTINPAGPRSSKRSFYVGVIVSLGLLSVFLMVGLVITGIYLYDSTASLSATSSKLSSMTEERDYLKANLSSRTEERDYLKANLSKKTKELERLQSLLQQKITCPVGWLMFSYSCYLSSGSSGSWDAARKDCRDRGADLVVIDSSEEEDFLTTFSQTFTWIGLTDIQEKGKWKWVDGTPLTLAYWAPGQPDNGGGDPKWGEENCVHNRQLEKPLWNDFSCAKFLPWVCEKVP